MNIDGLTVLIGDCLQSLKGMQDESVQCVVTSPPYFNLRDYGIVGQIGLETSPDEYIAALVEVFREVRRVLKNDGTLWLNIGDSYCSTAPGTRNSGQPRGNRSNPEQWANKRAKTPQGMKPKDLMGIPWRVAFALQQPYYTGKIADERDRAWLAAMVDAEGSICGTEYVTGDRTKTNIYISVTNTSTAIIDKCERLFPQDVKHVYEKSGRSNRVCYRWDVERMETKALFLREIYPHLVSKRKQAIVGYTFLELQQGLSSKKKGYLPEQQEQRSWLMAALSKLNAGEDIDLPDWVVEPPPLFEPGFYLRQDIIWAKPNPMPESVRDRCTKAHEYVFLLSKSQKYQFDSEAFQEAATDPRGPGNINPIREVPGERSGENSNIRGSLHKIGVRETRNRRSVWQIATQKFEGSHFATFPPDLVEPCILAGCPIGETVLDPFGGSGTSAGVALALGRKAVLCELNPEYAALMPDRIDAIKKMYMPNHSREQLSLDSVPGFLEFSFR